MKFYFHSIFIGKCNEKITNENSMKSSFTVFSGNFSLVFH